MKAYFLKMRKSERVKVDGDRVTNIEKTWNNNITKEATKRKKYIKDIKQQS